MTGNDFVSGAEYLKRISLSVTERFYGRKATKEKKFIFYNIRTFNLLIKRTFDLN